MGGWIDGVGLWEWQQRSMCVSGQQLGKVYSSLPLGFLPPRLPLWEKSEPNRYSRGRRGGFGKRRVRKQKAEAGSVLHVLSRDLPWRALEGQKEALESVYS